ncbi:T9SS type A sorting domain-containing protein [bacterium BMS3Abin03]|nr:T9SS type A sorting domain-containing protein [bacterium BMS3Abin03]MCG6961008.1 T9SS type A sorting domain-containing protein [bacterium BMS3Abin03]
MKYLFLLSISLVLFPVGFNSNSFAQQDVRIMAYNVYQYWDNDPDYGSSKLNALRNIIDPINPDIFVGVEIHDDGLVAAEDFRVNVLNVSTSGEYLLGDSPSPTGAYGLNGPGHPEGQFSNFLYYKPDKFTYLNGSIVFDEFKWPTLKFELYNNLTGDKIIIFGVHLSSTTDGDREDEANGILSITSTLVNGEYFIAAGDFNFVDGPTETAYGLLTTDDFVDLGGFTNYNRTFNARSGIYDRYDMILISPTIDDPGGISYQYPSYMVDGNTGGSTTDNTHKTASDHLPVYADFTFDFPSPVNPPYPGSIVFTQVGASDNDVIEFMTLYRMDLTTLQITDNGIDINGDLLNSEGIFDLSNLNGAGDWNDVPAGTFVQLSENFSSNDNDAGDRILKYKGSYEPTKPSLDTGGDQLIAYTGTSGNPTYIAGINWGNGGWTTGATDSHTSKAPETPSDVSVGSLNNYFYSGSVDDILYIMRDSLTIASNWLGSITSFGYKSLKIGNSALPVELVSFNGKLNEKHIELHWQTQTEVNNYGFNVERSINNKDWATLSFIEGNGNSNSPKYYDFTDNDITKSGNYNYRLKQIDNDGTFEYSKIVSVNVSLPENYYLSQNYPNPFNPETRIDFSIPQKQMVALRIYNTIGEQVAELLNEEKDAGSYSVKFNGSNLPSGIYIYRLTTQHFVMNKKMTLLK